MIVLSVQKGDEMRYIPIVSPVPLFDLFDNKMVEADGSPAAATVNKFLLARIADPAFTKGKSADAGARLVAATKKRIDSAKGGFVELEDEQWERICAATQHPEREVYDPRCQHCLVPLLDAVLEAKEEVPVELKRTN
jgi:hypothetical protein